MEGKKQNKKFPLFIKIIIIVVIVGLLFIKPTLDKVPYMLIITITALFILFVIGFFRNVSK